MDEHLNNQKEQGLNNPLFRKSLVKLLPAAAVAAAVIAAGVQANPGGTKTSESTVSDHAGVMEAEELEGLLASAYSGMEETEFTDGSTSSKKTGPAGTTKSSGIKKGSQKALPSKTQGAAGAGGSSGGQGSAQTPVVSVPASGYRDGTYQGSGTGFGGTITVQVTIKNGKIKAIDILDASGETPEYLASAKAVINRVISGQNPNVDAVGGATYSSNGIIQAIQNALSKADAGDSQDSSKKRKVTPAPTPKPKLTQTPKPTKTPKPTGVPGTNEKPEEVVPLYEDGVYTARARGYQSWVTVKVTVKKGKITDISAEHGDTPAFFQKAWSSLKASVIENQSPEGIDTVTGATFSSEGILEAVSKALKQAKITPAPTAQPTKTPAPTAIPTPTVSPEPTATPTPEPSETTVPPEPTQVPEPTEEPEIPPEPTEAPARIYQDGTYTGQGTGLYGPVAVSVTLSQDQIVSASVAGYEDDDDYFWMAWDGIWPQIQGQQSADGVDTVSGATFSSQGIIGAFQSALSQAKGA